MLVCLGFHQWSNQIKHPPTYIKFGFALMVPCGIAVAAYLYHPNIIYTDASLRKKELNTLPQSLDSETSSDDDDDGGLSASVFCLISGLLAQGWLCYRFT